jgi:ParB/RepB/Spo0J family partition protein
MNLQSLSLALVYSSLSPVRELQPEAVTTLKRSMERLGLRVPITVRPAIRVRDGRDADVWEIVSGRHRVEAARKLGWSEIMAVVTDGDAVDARLWEIAENLHRAELTVQERADHIAEWVRLTEDKEADAAQSAPHQARKAGQQPGGINAAVRGLGIERTEAQRAVKIASITPEARVAADAAGLMTQTARLAIAQAAPDQQVQRVAEVAANRVKPVPTPLNDIETEDQWRGAMMRLWNRAPDEWRERFVDYVQQPVFDSTRAGAA